MKKDKLLFIAPLPPPITGQALASEVFLTDIRKTNEIEIIDYAKKNLKQGVRSSFSRLAEIFRMIKLVLKKRKECNCVYFTITQSVTGNLRDLIVMYLLRKKKIVIHLHGGGIKQTVFDKSKLLKWLNKKILRYVNRIILLGDSLRSIYSDMVSSEKIQIVKNSVSGDLFINVESIVNKFSSEKVNILFLSNLLPGKGHKELIRAIKSLPSHITEKLIIKVAGGFDSEQSKRDFMDSIAQLACVEYCGVVQGDQKKDLFQKANVFILPTYYPYEGQPISILEAYAAGCVVVTTLHNGIVDIFDDKINGFAVEKKSVESIKNIITHLVEDFSLERLCSIAKTNRDVAEKCYTNEVYINNMRRSCDLS